MNYLAHLYLSGNDEQLIVGNFIADDVKGNAWLNYNEGVQKGIKMHRMIDTFTDSHAIVRQGKVRLRSYVGRYAPVALDILYDHYMAADWKSYHPDSLDIYTKHIYNVLDKEKHNMPERTQRMYGYMRSANWLAGYATIEGIERALIGLSRRTRYESNLGNAVKALNDHYNLFSEEFKLFFSDLVKATEEYRSH